MTVEKFGGAVLRTPQGFAAMTSIVRGLQPAPCLVVVSAIGSTTRDLATVAECSRKAEGIDASSILEAIAAHHIDLAREIVTDPLEQRQLVHALNEILEGTRRLCRSIAVTRQCTPRTLDRMIAAGEDLARTLAVAALRASGLQPVEIDARALIITDDTFGSAQPDEAETRRRVAHAIGEASGIMVTQGFVASTHAGDTTTMGRESSNLSAALLAASTAATSVTIWTDVSGVQTADPSICALARAVPHLDYEQARVAARYGLKLLYPTMIEPAQSAGILVRIASAFEPQLGGTRIDASDASAPTMIASTNHGRTTHVTMLFVSIQEAIDACGHLISRLGMPIEGHVDIVTHMHDRAASIVLPADLAPLAVQILHEKLCQAPQ